MVGRLVQQEYLGLPQDEPGQIHPGLLSAGEVGEKLCPHGGRDIQTVADLVEIDLGLIAPLPLVSGHKGVIPGHGGLISLPHLFGQLGHLPLHGTKLVKGGVQHVLHGVLRGVNRDLGDQAHPLTGGGAGLPFVGMEFPGEKFEKGGLAGAVSPQQSHPLPLVHLKGEAV